MLGDNFIPNRKGFDWAVTLVMATSPDKINTKAIFFIGSNFLNIQKYEKKSVL
jgi:hypothetical protein